MSFLIDGPWLYANGRVLAAATPGKPAAALGTATVASFLAVSVSLYLNKPWTKPIWEACKADDGRDWMLNSGVLKIDHNSAGPITHAVSALIFATYPYWLYRGYRDGRR
jgi:hypothetical protein